MLPIGDFASAKLHMYNRLLAGESIENARQAAGEGLDKLVRYHYALKSQDPVLLAELGQAMEALAPSKRKPSSIRARIEARVAAKGWETRMAA